MTHITTAAVAFRTGRGSTVTVSGRHRGIHDIVFDWLEEGACIEAHPAADMGDLSEARLVWQCDCCGAGSAILMECPNA